MPKDLVALYEDVLLRCQCALGLPDAATTRSRLYSMLLHKPLDPRVAATLDELQLSPSYVRTHLLSIGSWPEDVRHAMREGLPYQDARRVAQLDDGARREVLDVFAAPRSARRASANARELERRIQHDHVAERLPLSDDGWTPPHHKPGGAPRVLSNTLAYQRADVAIGTEALPLGSVEALIAGYSPAGGRVVDPMAGAGTTAIAARATGRWAWSGDIQPRYRFIHKVDAAERTSLIAANAGNPFEADLVVMHPPSVQTWLGAGRQRTLAAYETWIDALIENAVSMARPSGCVAVIVRPHRSDEGVSLVTDTVLRSLRERLARLVGYHVLVEARGNGEWHGLVAKSTS